MRRQEIDNIIDRNKKPFEEISDQIWSFAETCYNEYQSSKLQSDFLREHGFRVEAPIAGLDTAFVAANTMRCPARAKRRTHSSAPQSRQTSPVMHADITYWAPVAWKRPALSKNISRRITLPAASATTAAPQKRTVQAKSS